MMNRFRGLIAIAAFSLLSAAAHAGDFFETDGVALRGYDPVAYFVAARPQQGQSQYSYDYKGSRFYFSSEENRRAFMETPEKYAPQFGGYCAYGTAQGYKVSTQPDAFAIVNDKLYLNYNTKVQEIWRQDVPGNIERAEKNWRCRRHRARTRSQPMVTRRELMGASLATAALATISRPVLARDHIEAVAFDAFALFDPRPVFQACETVAPGRGKELGSLWRTRQFEYQWLRALGHRYADFYVSTEAALEFAARSLEVDLTSDARRRLMQGFLELRAWPDVAASLNALRQAGKRTALLSNATPHILTSALHNSGLEAALDQVISTDRIRSFKPDPRAYQLGVDLLKTPKERIVFVAFAGWDVAGAKWFGYPTFWNNRQSAPLETLDVKADADGATLSDLLRWLEIPAPAEA